MNNFKVYIFISEESFTNYASGSGSGDSTDDTEPDMPDKEGSGHHGYTHPFDPEIDNVPPMFPLHPVLPNESIPKFSHNHTQITSNEIPRSSSGSSRKSQMTLARAMFTYLFPLVVIWFGGMIADLL